MQKRTISNQEIASAEALASANYFVIETLLRSKDRRLVGYLQNGVSSISGQSIRREGRYPTEIASYSPRVWVDFRNRIPDIARAVCPTDFSEGVRKAYEQVNAEMRKGQ